MDSGSPMMLPKGIVINSKNIYKEVADFTTVPPDKVYEYWHVYTTTHKKLKDPTACRLENFWWHVWGSDRRYLKGSSLSKLYEDISVGPTFVPLKGPNRWEGPDIPPLLRQIIEASAAAEEAAEAEARAQAQARSQQQPPVEPHQQQQEQDRPQPQPQPQPLPLPQPGQGSDAPVKANDASPKVLSSSASKPPPTHPILKKGRGPSNSGPKPTARFISPHESAEEDPYSDIPSSGSIIAPVPETRPPIASPAKKQSSTKKFVAASTAAKRRPLLPRRQSSQSTVTSSGSRDGASSNGPRSSGLQRSTGPTSQNRSYDVSEDSGSSVPSECPVISAKVAGKRPAIQRRVTSERKPMTAKQDTHGPTTTVQAHLPEKDKATIKQAKSITNMPEHSRQGSTGSTGSKSSVTVGSVGSERMPSLAPLMGRSQSHTGYERKQNSGLGRAPISGLFRGAAASTSTTNIAVQGTILDQSGLNSNLPSIEDQRREGYMTPTQSPSSLSILESHFSPTPPSASTSVPLGRTKSQLTLLLAREKGRRA